MTRSRAARRAALLASLLVHVAVLAVLGWRAAPRLPVRDDLSERPDVELTLVRPPPLQATTQAPSRSASDSPPPLTTRPQAAAPLPAPTPMRPAPTPAAVPSPSASPAAAAGAGVHPGPLPGAEAGGDFKGFLRAGVGCAHRDGVGLTRAEREACDQKAGEVAKAAPTIDKIAPEKRAYYEAVAAAYAKMHAPAPQVNLHNGDNLGVQERWAGEPGSHLPGFGCKAPLGRPRGYKTYHDKPPNSLKLGFLPCFITPPSGFLTEEADVQAPASQRERNDDAKHMRDLDLPAPSEAPVSPPGR